MRRTRQRLLRNHTPAALFLVAGAYFVMAAGAAIAAAEATPRGEIVPSIRAEHSPDNTYAVYLPKNHDAAKKWPALLVLDPRGRAVMAAEIFRAGAEEYGYVLMSSYDSRSDIPAAEDPNTPAVRAMLTDSARYSVDPSRIYMAGFSGTSKFAWALSHSARGAVAGIIGCGGGLPVGPWVQWKDVDHAYFGVAGTADFNHREMRQLSDLLGQTEIAHRFEYFEGRHQWLPAELATEAIGWMELQAMKRNQRERDIVLVETLYDKDLLEARELEAAGRHFEAWSLYKALARDFDGLRPTSVPAEAANRLAETPEVKSAQYSLAEALERERSYRQHLGTVMRQVLYQEAPPQANDLIKSLQIKELKEQAEGSSIAAQGAQRMLQTAFVHAAFYTPRVLFTSQAPNRAALSLQIAAAIQDNAPGVWFQLARAFAQAGDKKQAVKSLDKAVDAGFTDAGRLQTDPDMMKLNGTRGFDRILGRLKAP